jgi:hypothetical protein
MICAIGPRSIATAGGTVTAGGGGVAAGAEGRAAGYNEARRADMGDTDVRTCETCNTPLDENGACITCRATSQGLTLLSRSGYASVREMMELLEEQGLAPEIEQVPPRRPQERLHPLWNIYVPQAEVPRATEFLQRDWKELLGDPDAARAAERGLQGIDLDAGGEIECPACGHRFQASGNHSECPDCGLALGAPAEAAPDEAER